MIIRLQTETFRTHHPCCVCGDQTDKPDVCAMAFQDDGTEVGHVCENCIKAGPDEMKQRSLKAAEHVRTVRIPNLIATADWHEKVAGTIDDTAVPTMTEWSEAQKKFDAFFLGETDDLDLPTVHTPIVLPDGREVPVILR